jgi:hypothetical protein
VGSLSTSDVTKRVTQPIMDSIPDDFRTRIINGGKKGVDRAMQAVNLKKQSSLGDRFVAKVKQHPRAVVALAAVAVIVRRMRNGD